MQDAFGIVIIVVVAFSALVALATLVNRGDLYDQIGQGGFTRDSEARTERSAAAPAAGPEQEEEIRQMLDAQNARRVRRGQPELDVDEELQRLLRPAPDAALRAEVRELVVARNQRRERQGKEPLDVEAEVERQLRELT